MEEDLSEGDALSDEEVGAFGTRDDAAASGISSESIGEDVDSGGERAAESIAEEMSVQVASASSAADGSAVAESIRSMQQQQSRQGGGLGSASGTPSAHHARGGGGGGDSIAYSMHFDEHDGSDVGGGNKSHDGVTEMLVYSEDFEEASAPEQSEVC